MNQVISRAKAAALGHRAPSPTGQQSPSTPQISQEAPVSVTSMNWGGHAQTAIPLSSDDSGQPSSFAPDPSDYNKPLYTRGPPAQSPAKSPAETPFGAFRDPTRLPSTGGYQANFAQRDQHSPSDAPRFFGSQPSRGTVLNSSIGSGRGSGIGGLPMPPGHQNGSAYRGFPPSNAVSVDTQQLIEDRSHNQPQNYSSQTRTTGSLFQDMKQDMKTDSVDEVNGPATGANSNLPIHLRPPFGIPPAHLRGLLPVPQQSRGPGGRDVGTIDGRKERSSFQQDRVLFGRNDGVAQRDERERLPRFNRGRGSSPSEPRFMNGVPPRASQQQVVRNESWRDSGPTKNEKPWEALTSRGTSHNGPSGAPSHQRKTLLSSTSIPKPNGVMHNVRYNNLTLIHTFLLNIFIIIIIGIHLHTLVRFENSADAQAMIMRDGEMGIRVRPSTKAIFDEAVDGPPPITSQLPSLLHDLNTNDNRDGALPLDHNDSRDQLRKRTRSRSRSRSPRRRRGIRGRRRGFRSRSRSRDRDRNGRGARFGRRSRSRSPHRKTHQDPTRWCLQLTNVPFRCSEEELRQWVTLFSLLNVSVLFYIIGSDYLFFRWFSERVRPTRLIRTFYADGNASDRWIAEFESESLLERARGIRGLCLGRTIK
uniref:RRM domain-containing protein n=1 Tax=Heterorhabditis bacteriophora TaxID=37862 RepID=A0A1I7X265_HETBA